MKKNIIVRYKVLFPLIVTCLLTSCQTVGYVSTKVQTLTPPARFVNLPDTANIAIVASLKDDYTANDIGKSSDSLLIASVAMGIKENLEKSPKYGSYIFPVYTVNAGENGLTNEKMLDIRENSNANYLIFIEDFKSTVYTTRVRTARNNCVRMVVPHSAVIKIYDIDRFAVIDERLIKDTLTLQTDVYSWETEYEIQARLIDEKTAVLLVIKEMAKFYAEEIAPFWKEETRFYYISPNTATVQDYIDNEEWTRAMNVWLRYVNDENRELAAISCFNMALGCEMMGDYELALKWMDNVKRKDDTYYWDEYKKLLEKRIDEKAVLDQIMK